MSCHVSFGIQVLFNARCIRYVYKLLVFTLSLDDSDEDFVDRICSLLKYSAHDAATAPPQRHAVHSRRTHAAALLPPHRVASNFVHLCNKTQSN